MCSFNTMRLRYHAATVWPLLAVTFVPIGLFGQSGSDPKNWDTKNWTAAEDHQNMMDQLGIKALRPGPSGNENAPNHANYDEATANPYPVLPDALTLKNGKKVTTPAEWWNQRRPEIVEDFEREVLGRIPRSVPTVKWEVTKTAETTLAGRRGCRQANCRTRGQFLVSRSQCGHSADHRRSRRCQRAGAGNDDVRRTHHS